MIRDTGAMELPAAALLETIPPQPPAARNGDAGRQAGKAWQGQRVWTMV
jgi:hypothetical protein